MLSPSDWIAAAALALAAVTYWSPPLRNRRAMRHAIQERLLGRAAVYDKNGREITPPLASVHEEIADLREVILSRPALNGQWPQLMENVELLTRHQLVANENIADIRDGQEALVKNMIRARRMWRDALLAQGVDAPDVPMPRTRADRGNRD